MRALANGSSLNLAANVFLPLLGPTSSLAASLLFCGVMSAGSRPLTPAAAPAALCLACSARAFWRSAAKAAFSFARASRQAVKLAKILSISVPISRVKIKSIEIA